ncbi:MAG: orotate phosphoribosyltransferase [Phycisphaeraceae bacterium]|nr:orotate phosphoribosyltransferase [Phycisphaeraceae bacterium]
MNPSQAQAPAVKPPGLDCALSPQQLATIAPNILDAGKAFAAEKPRIARLLADACVLRGTFTLRSGRTSKYYVDKYLFSTRPDVLRELGPVFALRAAAVAARAGRPLVRLAGAELGGIPLVTVASLASGLPCIFVRNARKDYGTSKQLEGTINRGDAVVFIEDVATTGGQALEAVGVLRAAGAEVLGVVATIDRQEGARENVERAGLIFDALFTKSDLGIHE